MTEDYYNRRAQVYEEIYHRDCEITRSELAAMAAEIRRLFADRRVLEIACGTGYWTAVAAETARRIVAVDTAPEMLQVARSKGLPSEKVEFRLGDAYSLVSLDRQFDAGMAMLWMSHVPKARIGEFLEGFHAKLKPGSPVFMADNVYVPGMGGELLTMPDEEDTFKLRRLPDGTEHLVLKNYYDEAQLSDILSHRANDLRLHIGDRFWWASYNAI